MENIATFTMIFSFLLFIVLVYNKNMMKSVNIILLSFAVTVYMIGNYIEIVNYSLEGSIIGSRVRFIVTPFVPMLWYFSIREFCGLKFKYIYTYFLFMIFPCIFAYLYFTWEQNNVLIASLEYESSDNIGNLRVIPGPLFVYRLAYQYGINALGVLTLVFCYIKGTRRFKQQSILFLASVLIPIFNTATHVVKVDNHDVDITPYGLLISMILFVLALYRFGVFNMSNIIKEKSLNYLHEGVLLFDKDGIYMDSNRSAQEIFPQLNNVRLGTSIREMDYLPFSDVSISEDKAGHICEFSKEQTNFIRTFNVSISRVYHFKKCIGYSVILNNITQLKKLFAELEEKSIKDPLTAAYNRGYLFEAGQNSIESAKRRNEPFSVIMIDIDFFKSVNDTFGHVFGDQVLKDTVSVCAGSLRKSDLIARYGGEEFCVLLFNTGLEGALQKAEQLRLKISAYPFEYDGIETKLTASFGVATYQSTDDDFLTIVKRADENLYKAKKTGRNKVC